MHKKGFKMKSLYLLLIGLFLLATSNTMAGDGGLDTWDALDEARRAEEITKNKIKPRFRWWPWRSNNSGKNNEDNADRSDNNIAEKISEPNEGPVDQDTDESTRTGGIAESNAMVADGPTTHTASSIEHDWNWQYGDMEAAYNRLKNNGGLVNPRLNWSPRPLDDSSNNNEDNADRSDDNIAGKISEPLSALQYLREAQNSGVLQVKNLELAKDAETAIMATGIAIYVFRKQLLATGRQALQSAIASGSQVALNVGKDLVIGQGARLAVGPSFMSVVGGTLFTGLTLLLWSTDAEAATAHMGHHMMTSERVFKEVLNLSDDKIAEEIEIYPEFGDFLIDLANAIAEIYVSKE